MKLQNLGRCKFGEYCSYKHPKKEENPAEKVVKELKQEVSQLKSEIDELKEKVKSLEKLIADFNKDDNKQTTKSSEAVKTKSKNDKQSQTKEKSLDEIIRENSEGSCTNFKCDVCAKELNSKKKLKVHKAKWHTKIDPGCKHRSKNGVCIEATEENKRLPCGTIHNRIFNETNVWQCRICGKKLMDNDRENDINEDHSYLDEESILKDQFKTSV